MINKAYLNNLPSPNSNPLRDSVEDNSYNISKNQYYSQNEFDNLLLNSNLSSINIIK